MEGCDQKMYMKERFTSPTVVMEGQMSFENIFKYESPSGKYQLIPSGRTTYVVCFKNKHHELVSEPRRFTDAVKFAVELIEQDYRLAGRMKLADWSGREGDDGDGG